MNKTLTLYELNSLVRETIELELNHEYWVEAEISEAREVRGHCYLQLVQYDDGGAANGNDSRNRFTQRRTPVAQAAAKCWQSSWQLIRPHFERVTGQQLHAGMKVLLKVYAQFHETYGFSWIITDIDPTYTMGDMARKRQEIIRTLKEEGVFDLNKELALPMFAQRIAVVSSENAAGYGDFVNQLEQNEYGFQFQTRLFPAVMQGEQVETSIIAALDRINQHVDDFDCVVIIRGGGATADLSGFDTLALAENVANFPLPVITGIGHERDESILDMISHTRVKTPTAAAAFLVSHLKEVYDRLVTAQQVIISTVRNRMEVEKMRMARLAAHLPALFSLVRTRQEAHLTHLEQQLLNMIRRQIDMGRNKVERQEEQLSRCCERKMLKEHHRMELLSRRMEAVDPKRLLQRGYSITLYNGRSVRDVHQLKPGDEIETRLENGTLVSVVK